MEMHVATKGQYLALMRLEVVKSQTNTKATTDYRSAEW